MIHVVALGEVEPLVQREEWETKRRMPLPETDTADERQMIQWDNGERLPDLRIGKLQGLCLLPKHRPLQIY